MVYQETSGIRNWMKQMPISKVTTRDKNKPQHRTNHKKYEVNLKHINNKLTENSIAEIGKLNLCKSKFNENYLPFC